MTNSYSASLKHAAPPGVYVSLTPGDPTLWSSVLFVRSGRLAIHSKDRSLVLPMN